MPRTWHYALNRNLVMMLGELGRDGWRVHQEGLTVAGLNGRKSGKGRAYEKQVQDRNIARPSQDIRDSHHFLPDARGQVTSVTYTTTNTYNDQRGWLMRVVTLKGGTTLQDVTFTRDAAGKILTAVSAGHADDSWTYTYDTLDRLATATNAGNSALSQTFTYDSAHNMVSHRIFGTATIFVIFGYSDIRDSH